jgi:FKBP-type peptidyl-prolyl cis-trans isomerase FkpA
MTLGMLDYFVTWEQRMKQYFSIITLSLLVISIMQIQKTYTTPVSLQKTILKSGLENAQIAQKGNRVTVHYTGWVYDSEIAENKGKQFDSSYDRGTPFTFTIGTGQVIKGWDEGVLGMAVGEKRRLIIPASLAYGSRAIGKDIPANATLVFEVEVLNIA